MPTSEDKNLGAAYNECASLVKDPDHWMCFKDRDVMFMTNDYINMIPSAIEKYPDVGLFTCMTNRVGNLLQCYGGKVSEETSLLKHYDLSVEIAKKGVEIKYTNRVISGLVLIIQKRTWLQIRGAKDGILGVDNDISKKVMRAGKKVAIMQGLYVLHYYRLKHGQFDKSHLV